MSNKITFKEFTNVDIRVGKVIEAERIPKSNKLIRCICDMGKEKRQVVAGFGKFLSPEDLLNKQVPIVVNVEPAKLMGVTSNGIFVAVDQDGAILLTPDKEVPNGSKVR